MFVSISPLRAVNCRTGRAQFKVTLGSNLAPVVSTVPLQFSFNLSKTLSEVRDLSLQVAAGPANGPPVPPTGKDYLGAFVDPEGPGKAEPVQAKALDMAIGRPQGMGILHWVVSFGYSPTKTATAIGQLVKPPLNAVPLLDWSPATSCGSSPAKGAKCVAWLKGVASGADDRTINAMAVALKKFGKPMLLRFFGEMNLHLLSGSGQYFDGAWDHIVALFSKQDVPNVAFVWAPGLPSGPSPSPAGAHPIGAGATGLGGFFSFYPGASEVDWIGVDAYDQGSYGAAGFRELFEPWYARVGQPGPPNDDLGDGGAHQGREAGCPGLPRSNAHRCCRGRAGGVHKEHRDGAQPEFASSSSVPEYQSVHLLGLLWRRWAVLLRQRRAQSVREPSAGAVFLLHGARPVAVGRVAAGRVAVGPVALGPVAEPNQSGTGPSAENTPTARFYSARSTDFTRRAGPIRWVCGTRCAREERLRGWRKRGHLWRRGTPIAPVWWGLARR